MWRLKLLLALVFVLPGFGSSEALFLSLGVTLLVVLCECVFIFQVTVYSGVSVCKTYHARRQRGQIQQLLVLLKGEKLQRMGRDK